MTAKEKLEGILAEGKQNMTLALVSIQDEFNARKDIIAKPSAIDYDVVDGVPIMIINGENISLTDFSEGQLYQKVQIPASYAKKLLSLGEHKLYLDNIRHMNENYNGKGLLVRKVNNVVKGILSPAYRRMDASPVFEGFVSQALTDGFMPYRGMNTNSKYNISFLYPELFEIAPSEFVVYGMSLTTSDYGASALSLDLSIMRVICTNLAIGYDMLRKVHIGRRFNMEDGDFIELSDNTYNLDNQTIASAIKDTVKLSHEHIKQLNHIVVEKVSKEVNTKKVIESLKKRGISKEVADRIQLTYDTPMPIEALPQVLGVWKLSNTISLIAQNEKGDNKLNLEKEAMAVLLN